MITFQRIRFLVIALKDTIEIYAWAPKPYHKFMPFKSFGNLPHRPLLVHLTVEEDSRIKVLFSLILVIIVTFSLFTDLKKDSTG
jgi:hypothetical protein